MNADQGAALQRLAVSRARLHAALLPPAEAPDSADAPGAAGPGRLMRRLWRQLRRAGRNSTVVDLALGALQSWWLTRPWRPAVNGVRQNLETTLVPLVRRHPWAAVGVAAAAGALVVSLKPWRWVSVRGTWPMWRAGLTAKLVQQAAHLPWDTLLAAVMAGLATAQARRPPPDDRSAASHADRGGPDRDRPAAYPADGKAEEIAAEFSAEISADNATRPAFKGV